MNPALENNKAGQKIKRWLELWAGLVGAIREQILAEKGALFLKAGVRYYVGHNLGPRFLNELQKELGGTDVEIGAILDNLTREWQNLKYSAQDGEGEETWLASQMLKYFWNVASDEIKMLAWELEWSESLEMMTVENFLERRELKLKNGSRLLINQDLGQKDLLELAKIETWQEREWQNWRGWKVNIEQGKQVRHDSENKMSLSMIEKMSRLISGWERPNRIWTESQELKKVGEKKLGLWRVKFDLPLAEIIFPDQERVILWSNQSEVKCLGKGWERNENQAQKVYGEQRLTELLIKEKKPWQADLEVLQKRTRKTQLAARSAAPILALVWWREAEIIWREQLLAHNYYPLQKELNDLVDWSLNWETDQKEFWQLVINGRNSTYLQKLNEKEKLLAIDDWRLWREREVEKEFRRVVTSDEFSTMQKEVYLALLAERQELKQDWFWATADDEDD